MISLRLLTRNGTLQLAVSKQRVHTSKMLFDQESSSSDSSDDEKQTKNKTKPNEEKITGSQAPVHRLNTLLQAMIKQPKVESKVDIAVKPKKLTRTKPETQITDEPSTKPFFEDKLTGAAKEVAASLGGDVKKTESELLKRILTPATNSDESIDLSKLVLGMNIDRTKSTSGDTSTNRAEQVRAVMQRTNRYVPRHQQMNWPTMREQNVAEDMPIEGRVDIDSGNLMNLFKATSEADVNSNTPTLSTWDSLEAREYKLLTTHPPINYIEQMIQWTEQGKLWRFPIDNYQDSQIGQEEHFSEHVFLEQHLEGWCPKKGPIRHFMELVCVGLSKNPYMLAKDKRERIMWFKEYFDKKRDLLQELGAYGVEKSGSEKKPIEA